MYVCIYIIHVIKVQNFFQQFFVCVFVILKENMKIIRYDATEFLCEEIFTILNISQKSHVSHKFADC